MSSTTEGFYFECEPVELRDGESQIKEVIELRYPNLKMKIDDKSKSNYLQLIFLVIFFTSSMIAYSTYGQPGKEILVVFSAAIAGVTLIFIGLTATGLFND